MRTKASTRYWLYVLAVAAFLGWAPACTGVLDDAPLAWKTYEHNRDRENSADCAERPNFAFDFPSGWEIRDSDCDSVTFDARNDPAELQVVVLDLPNHSANAEAALDQMQNQWSRQVNIAEGRRTASRASWVAGGLPGSYRARIAVGLVR